VRGTEEHHHRTRRYDKPLCDFEKGVEKLHDLTILNPDDFDAFPLPLRREHWREALIRQHKDNWAGINSVRSLCLPPEYPVPSHDSA
jgi:hypothetical protein